MSPSFFVCIRVCVHVCIHGLVYCFVYVLFTCVSQHYLFLTIHFIVFVGQRLSTRLPLFDSKRQETGERGERAGNSSGNPGHDLLRNLRTRSVLEWFTATFDFRCSRGLPWRVLKARFHDQYQEKN